MTRARRMVRRFAEACRAVALGALLGALPLQASASTPPNVVVYVMDDADERLVDLTPGLAEILSAGVRFSATVPVPLCAPSRVSILTGLHAHNHGVSNSGDAAAWAANVRGRTMADWFKAAGYKTARFGKWINGVPRDDTGWDVVRGQRGRRPHAGEMESTYWLDALTQDAVTLVATSAEPLFVYFAPASPHRPFRSAPTYQYEFADVSLPAAPSFNQADMLGMFYGRRPLLTSQQIAEITEEHRLRRRMMLSIVDSISALRLVLEDRPTYFVIVSDNGYLEGQHRIAGGKGKPFREATQVPLAIIGPGIAPGRSPALVYPMDIAPTVADLAGIPGPSDVDAQSLRPLLDDPSAPWRARVLLEQGPYVGVLTAHAKFLRFRDGTEELYDLDDDPGEMRTLCPSRPARRCGAEVDDLLREMLACRGVACWLSETKPHVTADDRPRANTRTRDS